MRRTCMVLLRATEANNAAGHTGLSLLGRKKCGSVYGSGLNLE